jgi:nucleoside transporter
MSSPLENEAPIAAVLGDPLAVFPDSASPDGHSVAVATVPTPSLTSDSTMFGLELRLGLLMFLQYLPTGIWYVPLGSYIGANTGKAGLGIFGDGFVGMACGSAALGCLVSPLVAGILADRYLAIEKVLCVFHVFAAGVLLVLANTTHQTAFFWTLILYFGCLMPTTALTTALVFHQLPRRNQQFPRIRAGGTLGWAVGGWFVGFLWPAVSHASIEPTTVPMYLGGCAHLLTAVYCFSLPHTPPPDRDATHNFTAVLGADMIYLLKRPTFALFFLSLVCLAIPFQFYNNYINLFLYQTGVSSGAGKLTIGQLSEVAFLFLLPYILVRWGLKTTLLVGVAGWIVRYLLLLVSDEIHSESIALAAVALHGICYNFVYVAGQMFVDQESPRASRAAAQGLFIMLMMGVGHFIGSVASGWAQARYLTPQGVDTPPYDWHAFWMLPTCAIIVMGILFALTFRNPKDKIEAPPEIRRTAA